MDVISKERRSWNMSRIKSRDTKPEKIVRSVLHKMGYRFRLHVKKLPGKPDIVLHKYRSVIFVHGCFWHLHSRCRDGTIPKTRSRYWQTKLTNNRKRDAKHIRELRRQGWKVLRLWECEIEKKPQMVIKKLTLFLEL